MRSAVVFLYCHSDGEDLPAPPSKTSFDYETGVLHGDLGGWSQSVPAGFGKMFVISATAVSDSIAARDCFEANEWTAPVALIEARAEETFTPSQEAAVRRIVRDEVTAAVGQAIQRQRRRF